ncbi:hypothetical protein WOLCODRAFT_137049 [Wolfiporia cocos MD-104 SS10]|uniref:non-specific serine/threonine protein kinase n=1 Tax=Wolfiporia cocos (strain MD-104) TaxID=742152 RepID=A0A2H3JLY5_WOLCO|nr:hypothetical protein WOLCODRAFT_137049 [Wolfiporia cocos MD-104 SS10]
MPSKAPPKRKSSLRVVASPKVGIGAEKPVRRPLDACPPNIAKSSVISPKVQRKKPSFTSGPPSLPRSPIVDVEIITLDARGRRVSQERRVSRVGAQVNKPDVQARRTVGIAQDRRRAAEEVIEIDDDPSPLMKQSKKGGSRARPIIISSEESEGEDAPIPRLKLPDSKSSLKDTKSLSKPSLPHVTSIKQSTAAASNATTSQHPQLSHASSQRHAIAPAPRPNTALPPPAPTFVQWTPHPILPTDPFLNYNYSSPLAARQKPRQLTPIRARHFPAPPSPPSPTTPTDDDLSLDLAQLDISQLDIALTAPPPPAYLRPLLRECAQETPHEFSSFIRSFPLDPIVHADTAGGAKARARSSVRFQKIGEASYSEVFGIGDVVLKVIPLRDETHTTDADAEPDSDTPAPSDAHDVLKEIIVTRAVGEMCVGFVQLLRTYVVRGKYPSLLLDLWDEYHERKGSESVRPDSFPVSQMYAIIVLPNGGPDLETYTFPISSKTGWRQACSLFWQVARSLAEAEALVCFEHRDLHWGQILVKNVAASLEDAPRSATGKVPMDDVAYGVEATVIDLGLARMRSTEGSGGETHWTPFDEEIFEGEGDYQFDVYRMMRSHNGDSWEEYRPLTNVMWLHYLSLKLLHSKRLRPPPAARGKSTAARDPLFAERECYECLAEIEKKLKHCVVASKPASAARKGRRKTQAPGKPPADPVGPRSAAGVLQIAIDRGWLE